MIRTSPLALFAGLLFLALAPPLTAQDVPEGSPDAIAAFAEGMRHYVAGEHSEAATLFREAHELDKTFAVALFMASLSEGNAGNADEARALREEAWKHKDRLSPYYRYRLEAQLAANRDDQIRASRAAAEIGPGTKAWYNLALYSNYAGLTEEAFKALETLDPEVEPMRDWYSYWSVRAGLLHRLDRFDEALEAARKGSERFPESQELLLRQAELLGALGQAEALDELFVACSLLEPIGVGYTVGAFMGTAGAEATAHGHTELGLELARQSVDWYEDQGLDEGSVAHRNWYGFALYASGHFDRSLEVFDGLVSEFPTSAWYRTAAAMAAHEMGDRDRFEAELHWVAMGHPDLNRFQQAQLRGFFAGMEGNAEEAVRYLQSAVDMGMAYQSWWHRHPAFAAIADDPVFKEFLPPNG
jgi:tetratricopeptide (TPR) repeat protein